MTGARACKVERAASPIDAESCAFVLSSVSFSSFALSMSSCGMISPRESASSPSSLRACPPSSRIPASSSADFPKMSIATISRSVSFSILPIAATTSLKIASVFLYSPFASLTATPIASNLSAPESSCFFIFATAPVMDSTSTSSKDEAYLIF